MFGGLRVQECFALSKSVSFSQKKEGTCKSPSLRLHSINATAELDQDISLLGKDLLTKIYEISMSLKRCASPLERTESK